MKKHVFSSILWFVMTVTALGGCGNSSGSATATSNTMLYGTAGAESHITGTVVLKDSSNPSIIRETWTDVNGNYSLEVGNLKAPFLLSVVSSETATAAPLYSFSKGPGVANINPFSNIIVMAAAEVSDPEALSKATQTTMETISSRYQLVKDKLEDKLEPLFALYAIDNDPVNDAYEIDNEYGMFFNITTMTVSDGAIRVANRQGGSLIFTAPVGDIGSGRFYSENLSPNMPPVSAPHPVLKDSFSTTQAPSRWLGHAERVYSGNRVIVTSSYTVSQIQLQMYNIGSPDQKLQVGIYSHDRANDRPGSLMGTWSDPVSNADFTKTSPGQYVNFTGLNVPVTPGTYWIVFNIPTGIGDNNYNYSVASCINTTPRGQTYYNSGWGEYMNSQPIFAFFSQEP